MMKTLLFLTTFLLVSCSHSVHLVNVSDYKLDKSLTSGKLITAESKQFVVLGFVTQTNYVEVAQQKLIAQCSNGEISNITTRYSTSHGFFSWHNKILMQARCFN